MTSTNPYRERKWYNIGYGALISLILAFTIPIPFIYSMLSMKVYVALAAYLGTWLILVFVFIFFVRRSRPNAYHIIDPKVIKKTATDLHSSRIANKNVFISNELNELRLGKKIPVLDVWKTDTQLGSRHSFFSRIVHLAIDPEKKEMELLFQLPASKASAAGEEYISRIQMYHRIAEFLKIAAGDPHLLLYKDFFTTLVIECDILREDEHGYDTPVSVFSLELPVEQLWNLAILPPYYEIALERIADVRFSDGVRIEPHRMMQ